jgi:hypothetical protein
MGDMRYGYRILVEKHGENPLGVLGIYGRIIVRCVLRKLGVRP